jgi:topoisomerase-4 subunit A
VNQQGIYELSSFDLSNHFDDNLLLIEKYNPEKVFSVIYLEGKSGSHYLKRFVFENTSIGKKTSVISEEPGSKLFFISGHSKPKIRLEVVKGKTKIPEVSEIELADTIEVKGMKAMGNRLSPHEVKNIEILHSPVEEEEDEIVVEVSDVPNPVKEAPGLHQATPVSVLARDIEVGDESEEVSPEAPDESAESFETEDSDEDITTKVEIIPEVQIESSKEPESASVTEYLEDDATPEPEIIPEVQIDSSKEPVRSAKSKKSASSDPAPEIVPEVQAESAKEPEKPVKKVDFEITNPDDLDIDDKGQLGLF